MPEGLAEEVFPGNSMVIFLQKVSVVTNQVSLNILNQNLFYA